MNDIILGPVDDIPMGEGRAYAVAGRQIVVFRLRDGSLRALDAVCPHRGGPLADGLTDGRVVVCEGRVERCRGVVIGHAGSPPFIRRMSSQPR